MKENGFSALNDDSLHIVRSESKIDGFDDDLEKGINFSVNDVENEVVTDNKWMEFIINQIMSNSFKYMKIKGQYD